MAYESPIRHTKVYPAAGLAAASTRVFRGPKGMRGRLIDILGSVTTAIVGTTSPPRVQLGVGGDLTRFADYTLGTTAGTAAGTALVASANAGAIKAPQGVRPEIPADTDITLGIIAAVGTPAGVADLEAIIEWY